MMLDALRDILQFAGPIASIVGALGAGLLFVWQSIQKSIRIASRRSRSDVIEIKEQLSIISKRLHRIDERLSNLDGIKHRVYDLERGLKIEGDVAVVQKDLSSHAERLSRLEHAQC